MTRLNDLREVYDELTSVNFDFNNLPANSKYRKYYEWRTDPTKRELPDSSTEDRGSDIKVGLEAFGLPVGDSNKLIVRVSGRAFPEIKDNAARYGALATVYGIKETDLDGYSARGGFSPAKAIIGNKVASESRTSNITGKKYKRRINDTFTIPFGRVAATDVEFDRQEAIIQELGNTDTVTFKPEKLRRAR